MSSYSVRLRQGVTFGSIQGGFTLDFDDGYYALVGKNNAGKSSILQMIFREFFAIDPANRTKVCYIPTDRNYVDNTVQPGTDTFINFNENLYGMLTSGPIPHFQETNITRRMLPKLLLNEYSLVDQVTKLNEFLAFLGFSQVRLPSGQVPTYENIALQLHGTGIRSIFYILCALTDEKLKIILVDEPEQSLEPTLQKKLRDLLISESRNRIIIVATHSHLFLNSEVPLVNNLVVTSNPSTGTQAKIIGNEDDLKEVVFSLLGNSPQDLFFPNNFLVVEGVSDQIICEKIATLLQIKPTKVKIFSAAGIEKVSGINFAIENTLRPLVADYSPYSKKIVVLIDGENKYNQKIISDLKKLFGNRYFNLTEDSIEKYIPDKIYTAAGMIKRDMLLLLEQNKGNYSEESRVKKMISDKISSILTLENLGELPILKLAIEKAAE